MMRKINGSYVDEHQLSPKELQRTLEGLHYVDVYVY